jgi:hypothetical protein
MNSYFKKFLGGLALVELSIIGINVMSLGKPIRMLAVNLRKKKKVEGGG